jgi:hypothetical protein
VSKDMKTSNKEKLNFIKQAVNPETTATNTHLMG